MVTTQKRLGQKIRKLRKAKDLTQEDLAELACMDYTSINKIENGHRVPSLKSVEKIARALKVSLNELLSL